MDWSKKPLRKILVVMKNGSVREYADKDSPRKVRYWLNVLAGWLCINESVDPPKPTSEWAVLSFPPAPTRSTMIPATEVISVTEEEQAPEDQPLLDGR